MSLLVGRELTRVGGSGGGRLGLIAAGRMCDEFAAGLKVNEAVPSTVNIIGKGVRPAVGSEVLVMRGARGKSYVMNPGAMFVPGSGVGWGDSGLEAFLDEWSASRGWSNQHSSFWQDGGPYIDLFAFVVAVAERLFPAPIGEGPYFNLIDRWTFNITLSTAGADALAGVSRAIGWDELAVVADERFPRRSEMWLDCFALITNDSRLRYPVGSWSGAFGISEILAPALEECGAGVAELFTAIYEDSVELGSFEEIARLVMSLAR